MSRVIVKKSRIHGLGVFAQRTYTKGDVLKTGHIMRWRNFRGYNHSCRPNIVLARIGNGNLLAVVIRKVRFGQELTVSYNHHGDRPLDWFKCRCWSCKRKR